MDSHGYTTARASNIDNLDTTVSSRLASADYVEPTTPPTPSEIWENSTRTLTAGTKDSEIDAIKTKTDNLLDDDYAKESSVKKAIALSA